MAEAGQAPAPASPASAFNFKHTIAQMVQRNASDLLLKVGRPPTVRVNGELFANIISAMPNDDDNGPNASAHQVVHARFNDRPVAKRKERLERAHATRLPGR